jgi:hypothetical protein
MRNLQRGLAAMACVLACAPAWAAGFDLAAGPSVTASERSTAAVFASVFGEPPAGGNARFAPIGTLGWIDSRNTSKDDLDHEVFVAGGGVRMLAANRRWFASEQLVATGTRTGALSSRFEFMTTVGWQDGHFIVMLRHVSNAHLLGGGRNLGETMLLGGVKF